MSDGEEIIVNPITDKIITHFKKLGSDHSIR